MLDKNDEKKIENIVVKAIGGALEQIVLPEMQELKDDVSVLKEDVSDLKDTTHRIETKLNAEVHRHDVLSTKIVQIDKRVLKLEPKA